MEEKKKELIHSRIADDGDFGNTTSFAGNLGRIPEMDYSPDGKARTRFSVGVWQGKNQTLWWNVTVWEELAEESAEKLDKGMRVKIVGRVRSYPWQGNTRYEVVATKIEILLKKPANEPIGSPLSPEEQLEEDKLHETPY
jgi:single-strand DNA-binding protein